MRIDRNEAARIAALAHLELDDPTLEQLARDLSSILDYVDQLPSEGAALATPSDSELPLRDDVVTQSLARELLEENAPDFLDGFFVVPKVIGGEP
jgi:aspartyl-tRNA(Asn)/glutamyl-tRNA(Gln) amidotransferase subunit C